MIPHIIHYCWFGNSDKPLSVQKNIEQWRKKLPDYEIVEWNEQNFDVNYNDFTREAYEQKKYAFVSDVARLYALVSMGGIYLDTDVEVLRPFENLLDRDYFMGREYSGVIGTATIASCKGNEMINGFLHTYDCKHFIHEDGYLDCIPNTVHFTEYISQNYPHIEIFDQFYFSPKHPATRICKKKNYTYCVHHFDGTWTSEEFLKNRRKEGYRILLYEMKVRIISFFIDYETAREIKRKLFNFFR